MKVVDTNAYTKAHGSRASVQCAQGYQLNIPSKLKTLATCNCQLNGEKMCRWKFNKGDVMCVACPTAAISKPKGNGIVEAWKQKIINTWEGGMTILFLVRPYKKSSNGWSIAIDAGAPLSPSVTVSTSMMELTDVSNHKQMFSFTIKDSSPHFDATQFVRVPIMVTFNGISEKDQEALSGSTLHYYSTPAEATTCEVDRFECYPLDRINPM